MVEKLNIKKFGNKKCWQIKGCPASMYLNCKAYSKGKNCWEIKEGCFCNKVDSQLKVGNCQNCSIYKDYLTLINI